MGPQPPELWWGCMSFITVNSTLTLQKGLHLMLSPGAEAQPLTPKACPTQGRRGQSHSSQER